MLNTLIYALLAYSGLAFLFNLLYFRRRKRNCRPGLAQKISVLIPARNEEANLPRCLDSLLAQSYMELEIMVMDDESTDGTPGVLAQYAARFPDRIRVYRSRALPPGWIGKNWACSQLSELATGEWLLFTDADTVHHRDSIQNAYWEARRRNAALVSYLPDLTMVSTAEKIAVPVITFAFFLLFPAALIAKLKSPIAAMAVGTFLLIKRETYVRLNGHSGLSGDIVEDVSLARAVKRLGERCDLLDGTGLLYTRFYRNLREIWHGFSKNAFGAFGFSILPYLAALSIAYAVFLNPFLMLAVHANLTFYNPFFNQVLIILALRLLAALRVRQSLLTVIFHPFMVIFALAFCLNSLWKIIWGLPVVWKERAYRISK